MWSFSLVLSKKTMKVVVLLGAFAALSGCTFSPVYAPTAQLQTAQDQTRQIFVERPANRSEQVIRNELLFAFGQNQAIEPNAAIYVLDLNTRFTTQNDLVSRTGVSIASSTLGTTVFELKRRDDGETLYKGQTSSRATYDVFEQEFANIRAERDAENRAAREIAANINAQISGYFAANAGAAATD